MEKILLFIVFVNILTGIMIVTTVLTTLIIGYWIKFVSHDATEKTDLTS